MNENTNSGHSNSTAKFLLTLLFVLATFVALILSFSSSRPQDVSPESRNFISWAEANKIVLTKWNKSIDDLPKENLFIITPHNESIRILFNHLFQIHYAIEHGKRISIWWQDAGGGSSAILQHLSEDKSMESGMDIDVVFGGGEYLFQQLAERGLLQPLEIDDQTLAQIPDKFNGISFYNPDLTWCGNVISGFGFLYNVEKIKSTGLSDLETWQNLAAPELFGQVAIADPRKSGSTMAAFEMIVQSEADWQSGWETLFNILSSSKEFTQTSQDAANAPLFEQTAAAICIDFYGISRVENEPDCLKYVSPQGQTAFTPDPIAVMKDAPNKQAAQAFAAFVLSMEGQKLWGLQKQVNDPLSINALYRSPIRKDFYTEFSNALPPWVKNPYESGSQMDFDPELRSVRYPVLLELIKAAALDDFELMKGVRKKLIEQNPENPRAMSWLPENADTIEEIRRLSTLFKDNGQKEAVTAAWRQYYQNVYQEALSSAP